MNGFSQVRIGGTGVRAAAPISGDALHSRAYGWQSAGQSFAPTFMRHMHDFGTTAEQVAHVRVADSDRASRRCRSRLPERVTAETSSSSRIIAIHCICSPVETDNANAIIVTTRTGESPKHPLVRIRGVVGAEAAVDIHYQAGPISTSCRSLRRGHPLADSA